MRPLTRYALVPAVALAALIAASAPASAATGQLVLRGPGPDTVISNPGRGCQSTTFEFSEVSNRTNVSVVVYSDFGCTGYGLVVDPGQTMAVGSRHSVYIPS